MDKLPITYALIKSCWDDGADYLDCFWPFCLQIMVLDKKPIDIDIIQSKLNKRYELLIPIHSLSTIMFRAQQRKYIEKNNSLYSLTQKGIDYINQSETAQQVERRMNELFEDLILYLSDKTEEKFSRSNVSELLLSFIYKNVEPLTQFFNSSEVNHTEEIDTSKITSNIKRELVTYFKIAEDNKTGIYKTLQDIWLGAVISTILNAPDIKRVEEARLKRFNSCTAYLDTNFILSILELHPAEYTKPAKELFNLLKEQNFKLKVFNFTRDEICSLVNGYMREQRYYPGNLTIDSVYNVLKRNGWTKTDVMEFIINIDNILEKKGIYVDIIESIDLDHYDVPTSDERAKMIIYKPEQGHRAQNHDLAAINTIQVLRKYPIHRIENSKALFITSDRRLHRYDFIERGHKEKRTINEVILDSLLTDIIWLKNPNANLSLYNVIVAHSKDLFIKRSIWNKFANNLTSLQESGQIDEDMISSMFYGNYIENSLIELEDSDVDIVNEEYTLDIVTRAIENNKKAIIETEKNQAIMLESERVKGQQETDLKWLNKLCELRKVIEDKSLKSAKRFAQIFTGLIVVFAIGFFILITNLTNFNYIALLIGNGGIISIIALWGKMSKFFEEKLTSFIYRRKIKASELDPFFKVLNNEV